MTITHAPHVTVKAHPVRHRPGREYRDLPPWDLAVHQQLQLPEVRDGKAIAAHPNHLRYPETAYRHKLSCEVTGHNKIATSRVTLPAASIAAGPALKPMTKPASPAATPPESGSPPAPDGWTPLATAIHYQWLRDGKTIKGATKNTYTSRATDRKHKINCLSAHPGPDGRPASSPPDPHHHLTSGRLQGASWARDAANRKPSGPVTFPVDCQEAELARLIQEETDRDRLAERHGSKRGVDQEPGRAAAGAGQEAGGAGRPGRGC